MKKIPYDRRAVKKSFLSSLSRVIGVSLGAGAGSLLHNLVGNGLNSWLIAGGLAVTSFFLMWFAEYLGNIE